MEDEKPTVTDVLKLSYRTTNRLVENEITTLIQIMDLDEETVMAWKNAGAKVWNEIRRLQEEIGTVATRAPVRSVDDQPEPAEMTGTLVGNVVGLIDWAVDAIAYDKEMARGHLKRARNLLLDEV